MNGLCNTVTHSNLWAPKSTCLCNSPVKKNSNDLCRVLSFFNRLKTLVFPGSQWLCGHRTSLECIAALNASTRACLFDCCLKKNRIFMEMNPWSADGVWPRVSAFLRCILCRYGGSAAFLQRPLHSLSFPRDLLFSLFLHVFCTLQMHTQLQISTKMPTDMFAC